MRNRFYIAIIAITTACALGGCGRSREEIERERKQIEFEEQARRDVQKANKAITEMNKKLGRKLEPLDLGLPAEKNSTPSSEPTRKP